MGRSSETAEIDVEVVATRETAIMVTDGDVKVWIPHSLIHEDSSITADSEKGDSGTLVIPQWKAEEAGLV
jgi:hypothetical protein